MNQIPRMTLLTVCTATVIAPAASADEGMWLLTNPPTAHLNQNYGFTPTAPWLEHVQKSCVRISSGGSGSIVSADGLVLTNHHVGSDVIAKLSTRERDLMEAGFLAAARTDELKCPDLEVHVLWTTEDVTERVNGAAAGVSGAEANTARRKAMSGIEKEAQDRTGLLSQVVTLYQGGRYHLYGYKRYDDVRLVFAPESAIAFFGGDADNFEFPRYNLDMCLFRIYEEGRPLRTEHHLSWSPSGGHEGELALVIGHPGTTKRLFTTDHLRFVRDTEVPTSLRYLWRAEVQLQEFMARSAENRRVGSEDWLGVANSRKAYGGQLASLLDPAVMDRKAADEKRVRDAVRVNAQWNEQWGDAWDRIAAAEKARVSWYARSYALQRAPRSELFSYARDLVRLADELPKPSVERLREYRDSALETVYFGLYSPAPIHDDLEVFRLASSLSYLAETLGASDPVVVAALAGRSPRDRAEELVRSTTLRSVDARRALAAGGKLAIESSTDPLIQLAIAIDYESRAQRARFENEIEAVERENYAKIAQARFALDGENAYPDATFTLRMSFGPVKGYTEEGRQVPAYTDFAGVYERHAQRKGQEGFDLPERWISGKDRLDLSVPFNFVFCGDIIGGNSGSPVINTRAEVIGLVFDGNVHSLAGAFAYDGTQNRAVAVDSRAIIEALRKLYGAGALADELTGRSDAEVSK